MDKDLRRNLILASVVLGALYGLVIGVQEGVTWLRLQGETGTATGSVINCYATSTRGGGQTANIRVSYLVPQAGNEVLETVIPSTSCEAARRASVPVLYALGSPDVAMTRERFESAPERLLLLAFFEAVVLVVAGVVARSRMRPAEPAADDTQRDLNSRPGVG